LCLLRADRQPDLLAHQGSPGLPVDRVGAADRRGAQRERARPARIAALRQHRARDAGRDDGAGPGQQLSTGETHGMSPPALVIVRARRRRGAPLAAIMTDPGAGAIPNPGSAAGRLPGAGRGGGDREVQPRRGFTTVPSSAYRAASGWSGRFVRSRIGDRSATLSEP
jgi:hypothetical protein